MRRLSFFVPGIAQPSGSKRIGRHGDRPIVLDANPKASEWKQRVALAAAEAKRVSGDVQPWEGPLQLIIVVRKTRPRFHFNAKGEVRATAPPHPATKPDLTKLIRGCEDAMKGIVWIDDAQIVYQQALKRWVNGDEPGVSIAVCDQD